MPGVQGLAAAAVHFVHKGCGKLAHAWIEIRLVDQLVIATALNTIRNNLHASIATPERADAAAQARGALAVIAADRRNRVLQDVPPGRVRLDAAVAERGPAGTGRARGVKPLPGRPRGPYAQRRR